MGRSLAGGEGDVDPADCEGAGEGFVLTPVGIAGGGAGMLAEAITGALECLVACE